MSISAMPALTADARPGWKVTVAGAADQNVRLEQRRFASDAELVGACAAGEPGAFDVLVERHRRNVYHLCYRCVGTHEDASDLSQEVFLRVHRGLHRFRGNAALSTWLYRIGVNVCLNHVRAKRPVTEAIELERHVDRTSANPIDLVARRERAAKVRAAIARLPTKQRATLILRVYHELSHQEIADILGNSVGSVKANFFHALGNLKKLLASEQL